MKGRKLQATRGCREASKEKGKTAGRVPTSAGCCCQKPQRGLSLSWGFFTRQKPSPIITLLLSLQNAQKRQKQQQQQQKHLASSQHLKPAKAHHQVQEPGFPFSPSLKSQHFQRGRTPALHKSRSLQSPAGFRCSSDTSLFIYWWFCCLSRVTAAVW